MSDNNNPTEKNSSPSPVSLINQVIVSSRHPHSSNTSRRPSLRSNDGASSTNSRNRTGRSSIQMEPSLQSLLIAEGRAAEMIAIARIKRNELLQQANRESQCEIEAFRNERELRYQMKLHEMTQLERFQIKLDMNQRSQLEQMEKHIQQVRTSLINDIVHCVIDPIPVEIRHRFERNF